MTLAGRVALVTGASSGIGEATARALAREGVRVALLARRAGRLGAVGAAIVDAGGEALELPGDVTDATVARTAVSRVLDRWSRLDILVNNAGRGLAAPFDATTPDDLRAILELNLVSVLALTQAALPVMRRQGSGHIVNVSSVVGRRGIPFRAAYAASKFALGGLTESLRVELRGTGIRATLVYPVYTETEFHAVEPRKMAMPRRTGPVQTAEHVARLIVRCVQRPSAEVYPYRPARLLAVLSVVAPGAVDALLARLHRRVPR